MKKKNSWKGFLLGLAIILCFPVHFCFGADPIVIGVPTFLSHVDGKESLNTLMLAVDEINAKGGVKVGSEKRLFKVEALDIRDGAPGVPV
ncbi:MAG TPA: hypothetical protein VK564_05030, partial [Thermodesulfobacteriota bacterium]|nr:hypothetical protein [Thermodesulfobacteriota bacterium]